MRNFYQILNVQCILYLATEDYNNFCLLRGYKMPLQQLLILVFWNQCVSNKKVTETNVISSHLSSGFQPKLFAQLLKLSTLHALDPTNIQQHCVFGFCTRYCSWVVLAFSVFSFSTCSFRHLASHLPVPPILNLNLPIRDLQMKRNFNAKKLKISYIVVGYSLKWWSVSSFSTSVIESCVSPVWSWIRVVVQMYLSKRTYCIPTNSPGFPASLQVFH